MSGIAGAVRFDAGAVDPHLFDALAAAIAFRGPQGRETWTGDGVAFACARTGGDGLLPAIVADARIDVPRAESDVAAILDAHRRWGVDAPRHLLGDFSFAIWDAETRRLHAARDRFGVRPFYYARVGAHVVFSNTLAALLDLPALSRELSEEALADFLCFGGNSDPATTTYAAIARLPPAHSMTIDANGVTVRRYWTPEPVEPRPIREADAVEQLRALLLQSVRDRTRGRSVVVSMSGGLDSTSIAAAAARQERDKVSALTVSWRQVIDDDEADWARGAASALGIDAHLLEPRPAALFEGWEDRFVRGLEPLDNPLSATFFDATRLAATRAPTLFFGLGADSLFAWPHTYFYDLLRDLRLGRFVRESLTYAVTRRRRPPFLLRTRLRRWLGRSAAAPAALDWIRPEVARRYTLREKWEAAAEGARLSAAWLPAAFETQDAGATRIAIEVAAPYLDVRLIDFVLSLPPMPFRADKDVLRSAMNGWLPDRVRCRPKTPLRADPAVSLFVVNRERYAAPCFRSERLMALLDRTRFADALARPRPDAAVLLPVSLARWLGFVE
ncbi:MAG TPA: asparagine synthase-related protein [Thermoanaerobaculia bacterium]|nr:asparagine synthase-related protein [Thermoanaerobaculia bacterium]